MAWFGTQERNRPISDHKVAAPKLTQPPFRQRTKLQPATSQKFIDYAPAPTRTSVVRHMTAAAHAAALLELLQEADYPPGYQLNFAELSKIYREMCAQNRWRTRGWISVGRAFDLFKDN